MMKVKRIFALLLCAVMVWSNLPMTALAAQNAPNVTFSASAEKVAVGDTVTLTVTSTEMKLFSFACTLKFDKELLKCTSITGTNPKEPAWGYLQTATGDWTEAHAFSTVNQANGIGQIGFAVAGTREKTFVEGTVYTATFEALKTGTAEFSIFEDSAGTDTFCGAAAALSVEIVDCLHANTSTSYTPLGNGQHTTKVVCTAPDCGITVSNTTDDCAGGQATCVALAECQFCKQTYGKVADHDYGNLIGAKQAVHTQDVLEAPVAAHHYCAECGSYFTPDKVETTLQALTGELPVHNQAGQKQETVSSADCEQAGQIVDVTFCSVCKKEQGRSEPYEDTTKPALGHEWKLVENGYTWTKVEGGYGATAKIRCNRENCNVEKTVTGTVTCETTGSTCLQEGEAVYTAAFAYENWTGSDTKTDKIPVEPTAHTEDLVRKNLGAEGHKEYYPCCQQEETAEVVNHIFEDGRCVCGEWKKPNAAFTATGYESGTLSNVTTDMLYSLDGGIQWVNITDTTIEIEAGITPEKGIQVKWTDEKNPSVQKIDVYRELVPSGVMGGNGQITGTTAYMEYKAVDEDFWQKCGNVNTTAIMIGQYQVRTAAIGKYLASDPVTVYVYGEFSITYVTNGGIIRDANKPDKYASGTGAVLPVDVTKANHIFLGWSESNTEFVPVTEIGTDATGSKTFYAWWQAATYTITYHANNGTNETSTSAGHVGGYTLPGSLFKPVTGYRFMGWSKTENGDVITHVTVDKDTHLYAIWEKQQFTITFVDDNGEKLQSGLVNYSEMPVFTGATPTKAADAQYTYTFAGWAPEIKVVTGEATYTATYSTTVNKYTVKFVNEDGTELQSSEVAYGETPAYSGETPTKDATAEFTYSFAGWDPEIVAVTGEATYTAGYTETANVYTVTWIVDGEPYHSEPLAYGKTIQVPAEIPDKEGHQFECWLGYTAGMSMPAKDVEFTVKWEAMSYNIKLDTDGDGQVDKTVQGTYGVKPTVADGSKAEDAGNTYKFLGWSTAHNGEVIQLPTVTGEATYYAVFETIPKEFTILLDEQDGDELSDLTGGFGAKVTLPAATREGYDFLGWSETLASDAAVMAAGTDYTITDNDTLFAKWQIKTFNVTYIDGEKQTTSNPIDWNSSYVVLAPDAKTGYDFLGWKDSQGETHQTGDELTITANVVLTAQWQLKTYAIAWIVDGVRYEGTVEHGQKAVFPEGDDKLVKPQDEQYTYTFNGWSPAVSESADGKATYEAVFTSDVRSYNITFQVDGQEDKEVSTKWGQMPVYDVDGAVPEKATDAMYSYTFAGWSPALTEVSGEAVYRATWTKTPVKHSITFMDGAEIEHKIELDYDAEITEELPSGDKTGYTFNGWYVITGEDEDGKPIYTEYTALPEKMPGLDTVVYGKWTINQYTIYFMDGDWELGKITKNFNEPISAEEYKAWETKKGHDFNSWSEPVPTTMGAENKTLTGDWTIKQYTITFLNTGDTVIEPITQNYGTEVQWPADPEKAGYTFNGWNVEAVATMPDTDLTVNGSWTANAATVVFDGYSSIETVTDADISEQVKALGEPEKDGHSFDGWVDADGNSVSFAKIPAGGMTVYAKWTVDSFTVSFYADANDNTAFKSKDIPYGTPLTADYVAALLQEIGIPEMAGYSFNGWNTDVLTDTMPASPVKVCGSWTVKQYTITFWDGENSIGTITKDYLAPITAEDYKAFENKVGHTFNGWDKTIPAEMPLDGMTVNGSWTIKSYRITFDEMGGTAVEDITANYNAAVTEPEAPTKTGHHFMGWSIDGENAIEKFPETMPENGLALKALWAKDTIYITWNVNGHTETHEYLFKDEVIEPEVKNYADSMWNYSFVGWKNSTEEDAEILETIPAAVETTTYYAEFEQGDAVTYTVKFQDGEEVKAEFELAWNAQVTEDMVPEVSNPGHDLAWAANGQIAQFPYNMTTASVSFLTQWTAKTYTIKADGEEHHYVYGTPVDIADPEQTGKTFAGWLDKEGNAVKLPDTMPDRDIEVTSSWTVNQYELSFAETGETVMEPILVDYGAKILEQITTEPVRTDYRFLGWKNGQNEYVDASSTMPAQAVKLTAQWKYIYTGWKTEEEGVTYLIEGEKAYISQWAQIEGDYYFFDDQGYIVYDLHKAISIDGGHEGIFVFGEDGKFLAEKNGLHISASGDTWWVEKGEIVLNKGLTRVVLADGEVNYYYFAEDGKALKSTSQWLHNHNDYLVEWEYAFDENGVIFHHADTSRQGVHADEHGVDCYYIDGVKVPFGLFKDGEYYYYARSNGALVKNQSYWISNTNGLLDEGSYYFDELGRIVLGGPKNGIYAEADSLYYYVNGNRSYAGVMKYSGDLHNADGSVTEDVYDNHYIYVNSAGEVKNDCRYWISKTNGLLDEKSYVFDEAGRIIFAEVVVKDGFVEENGGIYYYENGKLVYAGLIKVDGYYYYVNSSCRVITGRSYWISKTNGLKEEKSYTFDEKGRMILEQQEEVEKKNGFVEENGGIYYYVDGKLTYAGLIEVNGDYYYVNSSCKVITGQKYWISKTNGLKAEKSYTFDETGKMILG